MNYLKCYIILYLLFMMPRGIYSQQPALEHPTIEIDSFHDSRHPFAPYPSAISEHTEPECSSEYKALPPAAPKEKPAPKAGCCSCICTLVKNLINYCCSKNS